jgi:hypothetical protein
MIESFRPLGKPHPRGRLRRRSVPGIGLGPRSTGAGCPDLAEGTRQPAALQTLDRRRSHRPLVQSLLRIPYHLNSQGPVRAMSGPHVLNAIFIFWIALQLVAQTRDWSFKRTQPLDEGSR